jgi:protein-disulfide isomerase
VEKFIRTISTVITFVLFYVIASYVYLSSKGFVYNNGSFALVKEAKAASRSNEFAHKIDSNIAINFKDDKAMGDTKAPLTLYEFSSLGCSHCADFHLNILPKLKDDFISNGKLRVVFVNFPLDQKSMKGAMLSECLSSEKREQFLNTAFLKQREWMLSFKPEDIFAKYATDDTFTKEDAAKCMSDDLLAQNIIADRQEAIDKLKVQGTPAFLFSSGGVNEIIYGVPNYELLKTYIENRLL